MLAGDCAYQRAHSSQQGGAYAVANVESHPRFDVATIAIGGTAHTIRLRWGEDPVLLARRWCDRLGLSDGDCTTLRRAIVRTARTVWFVHALAYRTQ